MATKTYNQYVMEEAQKQTNNEPFNVYKVRRPMPGEEVMGYTNFSESLVKPTETEEAEVKDTDKGE